MTNLSYPLLPIEYVFTGPASQPITFAFSYKALPEISFLQEHLRKILEVFPILNSTLEATPGEHLVFRAGTAEPEIIAEESATDFTPLDDVRRFISPIETMHGEPLFAITLTRTPSGAVLAVSISHALVDGFSYFHFLSSWARACRGERVIPPVLDRAPVLRLFGQKATTVTAEEVLQQCGVFPGTSREALAPKELEVHRVFLPDAEITKHLVGAGPGITLTENDVITALLWKEYLLPHVAAGGNPQTYATCPFDFRRLLPAFPRMYFGCALTFATAALPFELALIASIPQLAHVVHQAITRIKKEQVVSSLNTLEQLRRHSGIAALQSIHLHHPHSGMIVTNLTRMPIADLDFGQGRPDAYTAFMDVPRGAAILPGVGGVHMLLGLRRGETLPLSLAAPQS